MSAEQVEARPKQDAFLGLMAIVEKSARTEKRIDLVTFVQDHTNGARHTYSPLGLGYSENEINSALSQIISSLTPSSRVGLEGLIADGDPSRTRLESHLKMDTWEWKTQRDRLILGVEILVDDRRDEEWVRTWYVRGQTRPLREKIGDGLFALTHPIEATRAKIRQVNVAIEAELPPHTQTIEEFPDLSLKDAAMAIRRTRQEQIINDFEAAENALRSAVADWLGGKISHEEFVKREVELRPKLRLDLRRAGQKLQTP